MNQGSVGLIILGTNLLFVFIAYLILILSRKITKAHTRNISFDDLNKREKGIALDWGICGIAIGLCIGTTICTLTIFLR